MTKFKYGAFEHPVNEVLLTRHRQKRTHTKRGHQKRRVETLELICEIDCSTLSNSDITLTALAREAFYEEDIGLGTSAGLFFDDDTETPNVLTCTADCINGIEVLDFAYSSANPLELATRVTFHVILKAEYFALQGTGFGSQPGALIEWYEEIERIGNGGPKIEIFEYEEGSPVAQTVNQQTKAYARQRGYARQARLPRIIPPDPRWPALLINPRWRDKYVSGTHQRITPVDFTTTWDYWFHATTGFNLEFPQTR